MNAMADRTLFEKIWDSHVVAALADGSVLLYIDCHLVNEVTSPQAFDGLRRAGRKVRAPQLTIAVADHNVPTENRSGGVLAIADSDSRLQVEALERNVREFEVPYIPLTSSHQGIVHIIGPELGLTQPGMVIVCGDSHTSTHGAFGSLAFGIGTSEIEHVLATQTLIQRRPLSLLIEVSGDLATDVTAKDLVLYIISVVGAGGAAGFVIEFRGPTITKLEMAGRMTLCNMAIEMGARAGMIAADQKTIDWLAERLFAPGSAELPEAVAFWRTLQSDPAARYDKVIRIDADTVSPMVTWGTSPDTATPIFDTVPLMQIGEQVSQTTTAMLNYMNLEPGSPLQGLPIDVVFIGSCTNGRLEDLRAAADVLRGRRVARGIRALVVPGSGSVKAQAEAEGLDKIFLAAGFEWREAGCSMCLGMNPDMLKPGERCASTSNRNFEGRQGPGGRTHLLSPAMAAAAAVAGKIVDVRSLRM